MDEAKRVGHVLKNIYFNYAEYTSAHGFRQTVSASTRCRSISWSILVFALLGVAVGTTVVITKVDLESKS